MKLYLLVCVLFIANLTQCGITEPKNTDSKEEQIKVDPKVNPIQSNPEIDPKVDPKNDPKVIPKSQPQVEPKGDPKDEIKTNSKNSEPKDVDKVSKVSPKAIVTPMSRTIAKNDFETTAVDNVTSMTPIEVTALGRAAQMGELYDARSDQFIRLKLFNTALPKELISSRENFHTNLKMAKENSLEEKFNLMDISASLKVSVMSGMFTLEGSGKFFKDNKKSAKSAKATLLHKITTRYEMINMISSEISKLIDLKALNEIDCTHVVVGIQWGGNVFVSVEDTNQNNEDTQVIEGKLHAELEKLSLKISGSAQVNVSEEERKKYSKFSYEIFGDVLPDNVPQNLVDAVIFMQDVPKHIKSANEGRGKAMVYSLVPIALLRKRFGDASKFTSIVKDVNDATVKKATRLFDEMNEEQAKLNDLMNGIKHYQKYLPSDQVQHLQKVSSDFRILQSELQEDLAKHLIAVRKGVEEIHELEGVLSKHSKRLEESKQNKTSFYNELKPMLKFVEFLQKQNVTILKKSDMFRQFLREHFDKDIYILFFKFINHSDSNENVINMFQKMLMKKEDFGKAPNDTLFVGASYEILNESKFPVVIDRTNRTKISFYRNNAIMDEDFTPGRNVTDGLDPEHWSLNQIQQILNVSKADLKELQGKHEDLSQKTRQLEGDTRDIVENPVPIGFIYTQLPKQKEPDQIWPSCKFEDVSPLYAGKFFRAVGGRSEIFGHPQWGVAPRLTKVMFMDVDDGGSWETKITPGKWSSAVSSGATNGPICKRKGEFSPPCPPPRAVSLKFMVEDHEVRPENYAVKLWKNTGCSKIKTKASPPYEASLVSHNPHN